MAVGFGVTLGAAPEVAGVGVGRGRSDARAVGSTVNVPEALGIGEADPGVGEFNAVAADELGPTEVDGFVAKNRKCH